MIILKIVEKYITNNKTYTTYKKIVKHTGLMLHSVGCAQPKAEVFYNNENKYGPEVSVHGFIDALIDDYMIQTLPWNYRAWHCGGNANDTHIGIEMCEPDCIKYTGGSNFTCSNYSRAREQATRAYKTAVQVFAYLCLKYDFNPLKDGVIISHKEGHDRGLASGHSDPEHLWKGLGLSYTMDGFRKDVAKAMGGSVSTTTETKTTTTTNTGTISKTNSFPAVPFKVRVKASELYIRELPSSSSGNKGFIDKGVFTITKVQDGFGRLSSGRGWIYIANSDWVEIIKAEETKTDNSFLVRVTSEVLRIRKGAGTDTDIVSVIKPGVYTILEVKQGQGSRSGWGRLKNGSGWIALDYAQRI